MAGGLSYGNPIGRGNKLLAKVPCFHGRTATFGEAHDLEYPYGPIKRDRHDVAGPHGMACRVDPMGVDPYVTRRRERSRRGPRSHDAGMPEPFVDALTIQPADAFTAALCCLRAAP